MESVLTKRLRVVTFNIHYGKDSEVIARAIKNNDTLAEADVILLQEVEAHQAEAIPRVKIIADFLNMDFVYAPSRTMTGTGTHGLAILSKYPLSPSATIDLPKYKIRFSESSRIGLVTSILVDDLHITLANAHLDTRINSEDRINQLKPLVEHVLKSPDSKIILGGDFNLLPFRFRQSVPFAFHDQKAGMHKYLTEAGFAGFCEHSSPTFRIGLAKFQLDALYARNFRVLECAVEEAVTVSDHKPLWFDVDLRS